MATAFFRTVILYLLLIAGLRITGKRQIGAHAGFRHPSG